jgi:predicted acetyltransferase
MAEFFVMKKYRRMGVGQKAAEDLFSMFPGTWRLGQMESNTPAQLFWRKIITRFTNSNYQEVRIKDWDGPVQEFTK